MEVVAFTEHVADTRIRYQIMHMKDSAMVWVQSSGSNADIGSLPSFSLSLPGINPTELPAAATVVPGRGSATSRGVAQKLAKRCDLVIYACIDLPDDAAGVLIEGVTRRLLQELQRGERSNAS